MKANNKVKKLKKTKKNCNEIDAKILKSKLLLNLKFLKLKYKIIKDIIRAKIKE